MRGRTQRRHGRKGADTKRCGNPLVTRSGDHLACRRSEYSWQGWQTVANPSAWSLAAQHLAGARLDAEEAETAAALLGRLGAGDLPADEREDVARLLGAAARLDRIFALQSPDMPGLSFFGAEVSPTAFGARWGLKRGVSGAGLQPLQAFRRCVGEAVEYLSQHDFGAIPDAPPDADAGEGGAAWIERFSGTGVAGGMPPRAIDCCPGLLLPESQLLPVPVDLCWRRDPASRQLVPDFSPGLGCAAGATREAAAAAAILELIERDALALWWRGGRRGRPVSAELIARAGVGDLLVEVREQDSSRQTWFLDLTTDLAVPVMAALSVDEEGSDFAFGLAAAGRPEDALVAACLQLGQLELADLVVATKLAEGGEGALNDIDRMHRRRAAEVSADWEILHPAGSPLPPAAYAETGAGGSAALIGRLAGLGHDVVLVDQTSAVLGVPVIRALIPSLQPDPGFRETERLTRQRAASGQAGAGERPAII